MLKIQYIPVENFNLKKKAHYDAVVQQGTNDIFVFFKNTTLVLGENHRFGFQHCASAGQ